MRPVLYCVVLLFFTWQGGPSPQKTATKDVKQHANQHQQPASTASSLVGDNSTKKDASQSIEKTKANNEEAIRILTAPEIHTQSEKDSYDKTLVIATCLLVLVGGFQIFYLWRAIGVTKGAADAARASAEGLVNSERAWVLVDDADLVDRLGNFSVRVCIKNYGKTIARIKKISLGGTRPLQIGQKLPASPTYEGSWDYDFILCPDRVFPEEDSVLIPINRENLYAIQNGLLKLYVFGLVEYLDLSGKERATGFVLTYSPPHFASYLDAPAAYYKNT